jgi:hypothetical protein
MAGDNHSFPKNGSKIFFAGGVDITGCGFRFDEVFCPTGGERQLSKTDPDARLLVSVILTTSVTYDSNYVF